MATPTLPVHKSTSIILRFIVIILLTLGIVFRFANIDQKAYWFDETFTSLQLSGYSPTEIKKQIIDGRILGIQDLQKYQSSNSEKSALDTIKGVATIEPQLTPLYFVMARTWTQLFGSSVAATRSFSAILSLLVFPSVYWLCWELFRSPLVGWSAIALIAVSPFHIIYAQEARPYSLWTVAILLSSAALLRATRLRTNSSWVLYGATVMLGLYSFLFSVLVSLAHGFYVAITERFRLSKSLIAYLLASLVGILTFAPWLLIVLTNPDKVEGDNSWRAQKISIFGFIIKWVRSISLFFVDFNINPQSPKIYLIPYTALLLLLVILVGYSLYFLYRHTPERTWLFIFTLVGVPALALILPDLILGGQRSTVTRYLIPCFLGIQLAVAYLFATQSTLGFHAAKLGKHHLWKAVIIASLAIGILSCGSFVQSKVWWNKDPDNINHALASTINQGRNPLLVSDTFFVRVLSLSHLLARNVQYQLVEPPNIPKIPTGFSNIFLFQPSQNLQKALEKEYDLKPVHPPLLWRLTQK